jgi:hypothetical protein
MRSFSNWNDAGAALKMSGRSVGFAAGGLTGNLS